MKALIVTHNFPRFQGDISGNFLLKLFTRFERFDEVDLLAPYSLGTETLEWISPSIRVIRFTYGAPPLPEIAYTGEMHKNAFKSPLHLVSLASFSASMLSGTMMLSRETDVINAHWLIPAGVLSTIASNYHRKPLVITMHGTDSVLFEKFGRYIKLSSPLFRRLRVITVVSRFIADRIRPFVPPEVKIEVVPMPIDDEIFSPEIRKDVQPEFDLVYVGRLTEQKNVDKLLFLVAELREKFRNPVTLLIVGDGPELMKLKRLSKELNLEDIVHFRGKVEPADVPYQMALGRIIISLSKKEGFGMSMVEGMKMGLPQIASNDGGMTDIVAEGETGLLVSPDDIHSAALAVQNILSDEPLYSEMSLNSIRRGKEIFSAKKLAEKFEEVLLEAAGKV